MIDEIVSLQNQLSKIVDEQFIPRILLLLSIQKEIIKKIDSEIDDYLIKFNETKDEISLVEINKDFHSNIYSLLENYFPGNSTNSFEDEYKSFNEELNQYLLSIKSTYKQTQADERFISLKDDSARIKLLKKNKNISFHISRFPTTSTNSIRRIFKKPTKPIIRWQQNIPLKNLAEYYGKEKLSLLLVDEIEKTYQQISSTSLNLFKAAGQVDKKIAPKIVEEKKLIENEKVDSDFDHKKIINESLDEIENIVNSIKQSSAESIQKIILQLDEAFQKAGTIELSKNHFNQSKIKKLRSEVHNKYKSIVQGWHNNLYALFDDWRLYEELTIVEFKTLKEYLNSIYLCKNKVVNSVIPNIDLIEDYLYKSKNAVADFEGKKTDLQKLLTEFKETNSELLTNKIVPQTIENLFDQNIPTLIDEFDVKLNNIIQNISKKRAVIKSEEYDKKLKSSEIDFISPHEIIISEALPRLKKSTQNIKKEILDSIDKIQKSILSLDQIADFNLESAIVLISEEGKTVIDSKNLALEGLDRAINKTAETKNSIQTLTDNITAKLKKTSTEFNDEILELTNTEKVFQIKLRIAKAKAVEKTKRYKTEALSHVKNFIPVAVSKTKDTYLHSTELYAALKKKLGIIPPVKSISSEVSDFLAETQNSIAKLPFVYQRLFKVEPLSEERFFEGRTLELAKLDSAYANWIKEYFASTVLVGEKGSGATSIINIFLKKKKSDFEIFRTTSKNILYDENEFIKYFKSLLKNDQINNLEEIASYLNNSQSKKIIIIENIQHLFLRKVNGFKCLKLLFELISKTSRQVFWITTSTLYAWNYLDKTINVNDHFGYVITIRELNYNEVIEIILKRHRVSGYNIYFEPSPKDLIDKNYKKLPEDAKQEYLRKEYFKNLIKFAKSNISLALLFWLRSTQNVTADTITIKSLNDLDFSFLASLSNEKIFSLNIMLLHDGINEEIHSLIFSQSQKQSRLLLYLLLDDGVIIKDGDNYLINPLLYRQTVSMLQAKNIIH